MAGKGAGIKAIEIPFTEEGKQVVHDITAPDMLIKGWIFPNTSPMPASYARCSTNVAPNSTNTPTARCYHGSKDRHTVL